MGLSINSLAFKNFRNYSTFQLEKINTLTIFVGPNAVGKTNIIEGIQLLTALTSLRNAKTEQLLYWGAEDFIIEVQEKDEIRDLKVTLQIVEGKKVYKVNGNTKRPKDLRGQLPAVIFTPDDLALIKGSQSIKRATLDAIGIQIHANYHLVKKDYEKLIRHKNQLLKEGFEEDFLTSINEMIVIIGVKFQDYRRTLFNRMAPYIKEYYESISNNKENLDCLYVPFWESADPENHTVTSAPKTKDEDTQRIFQETFTNKGKEEISKKISLFGPHADRIEFFINGKNAHIYGSQGQQRSLVLAFKLAEIAVIQETTNRKPIFLLDDVMSELDGERRKALLTRLSDDIQTFITTTTLDYFPQDILEKVTIIKLPQEGTLQRQNEETKEVGK